MIILGNVLAILQIITAIIVTFLVLLQSDKSEGSIITSAQSSTMGMSKNEKLAKLTAWVGGIFVVLTIASSTVMLINVR